MTAFVKYIREYFNIVVSMS